MTGERILVVEDNAKNMKLFRDVLVATGYRTLEATTGSEAIDMASEHTPDLVLMDIRLPDFDGVQALHRLRANARTATIPILALDDVPQNIRLLEAVLVSRGYDVISANDGIAALELIASAKPDLVLLDVMMPPPDGYEVCRRLREDEETAVLPVIMVTASATEKTKVIEA